MVDSLRKSRRADRTRVAKRVRVGTAARIAAIPVVVGLLMLSASGEHPLDHDVPEGRATAEQFAATLLRGSSAEAIAYVAEGSGISVEQLNRDREYLSSHAFEIVGPARFASDTFVDLPGYELPLEGLQGSHRLPHTLVVVVSDEGQGWKVTTWGWSVNDP